MDRNQLAIEMAEKLSSGGQVYMNEVAMPGVKPMDVNTAEVESPLKKRQDS